MINKQLSTKPYKGVRDFYPKDWMFQKWMFWKMKEVCELYGYENYTASPLEASELYEAKSGTEIVQNETYNLTDRGDRRVTLRPEMTPSVARMVADQVRELPKPIRWYSIPNLFRYERPQRGRLREHYQLNVDIFGVEGIAADIEVIELGARIMQNFGADGSQYSILINNRKIINALFAKYLSSEDDIYQVSKIIDKKKKLSEEEFAKQLGTYLGDNTDPFIKELGISSVADIDFADEADVQTIKDIVSSLEKRGVTNVIFDLTLMRGFDYYTDVVFEFFDTHPDNNRSMFGGGRYNDLLDIFGMEKLPAVGFGAGDVTIKDFLETHGLLPDLSSHTKVCLGVLEEAGLEAAQSLAASLRDAAINTEVDFTYRKYDKMIRAADQKQTPYFIAIGSDEAESGKFSMKDITTGEVHESLTSEQIIEKLSAK